jgi:hypothetical protein
MTSVYLQMNIKSLRFAAVRRTMLESILLANKMLPLYIGFLQRNAYMPNRKILLHETPTAKRNNVCAEVFTFLLIVSRRLTEN